MERHTSRCAFAPICQALLFDENAGVYPQSYALYVEVDPYVFQQLKLGYASSFAKKERHVSVQEETYS